MSKLLLIEGRPAIRSGLRAFFQRAGFSMSVANDPEDGLAQARCEDFEAVILNLHWKGNGTRPLDPSKGLQLVENIYKENSRVPIIVIASFLDGETIALAMLHGASTCLVQPVRDQEFHDLLTTVRNATRSGKHDNNAIPTDTIPEVNDLAGKSRPHNLREDEISDIEVESFTAISTRRRLATSAEHQRVETRLLWERWIFLGVSTLTIVGSMLVLLGAWFASSSQAGSESGLPLALVVWTFGRFVQRLLTKARENAIELQMLRDIRLATEFAFDRVEDAILSRSRAAIQSAYAELTADLQRHKIAQDRERSWNWLLKWVLSGRKRES